ncbi:MAG: MarR family transcriptional regulator [Pacificimonas sp.]|jgi:DNA-binding MarR family transcriptional regulator|nr:MarR family transcriptional regulator [Pacificimonas sp.]
MTVLPPASPPPASPQFLREDEVRRGIELIYFGYTELIAAADDLLADSPFGRAHHRALYFIARRPGLPVGELLQLLRITKQSLSRVINELKAEGLVTVSPGQRDRRQRLLTLTAKGAALEQRLFAALQDRMTNAYSEAGQDSVSGYWNVLAALLPPERRALALRRT